LDMNVLPDMPYQLVDIDNYLPESGGGRSVSFQSSRGCPLKCAYCYNTTYNKGQWRSLSADNVLKRIENLVNTYKNIENILFFDDNFFVDFKRARDIVERLKPLGVTYQIQGVDILTLKRMDEDFLKLLQDSGCIRLLTGIESGSEKIRRMIRKSGTVDDILAVSEKLKKYDIEFYGSFMIGLPGENIDDIKKSVDLLFKILKINKKFRNPFFFLFTPLPGTPLFDNVVEMGYKMPEKLIDWIACDFTELAYEGDRKLLESLHFVSNFVDYKTSQRFIPFVVKLMGFLYRPLARLRMKNLYFGFMIEKNIYNFIRRMWYAMKVIFK